MSELQECEGNCKPAKPLIHLLRALSASACSQPILLIAVVENEEDCELAPGCEC